MPRYPMYECRKKNDGVAYARAMVGLPPLGSHSGWTTCLRCERRFQSEDMTRIRICRRCKKERVDDPRLDDFLNLEAEL